MNEKVLINSMLSVLVHRTLSISNVIVKLNEEGYIPNKNKYTILQFCDILYGFYKNVDSFDDDIVAKMDILYNKVMKL